MTHWPRTDLHLHATHYRLEGARPEMTVTNIVRRVEGAGLDAERALLKAKRKIRDLNRDDPATGIESRLVLLRQHKRLQRQPQSPSQAINQLIKGCQLAMNSAILRRKQEATEGQLPQKAEAAAAPAIYCARRCSIRPAGPAVS